jgi:hypothetical protein
MSEPDPVFESRISDSQREALRAKLNQLLDDAAAIDAALYRLFATVWDLDEIDFLPIAGRIRTTADHLGDAVYQLKVKLANLDR